MNSENSLTQNEVHGRQCSLFSIDRQFAKVEVAGSNPVSLLVRDWAALRGLSPLLHITPLVERQCCGRLSWLRRRFERVAFPRQVCSALSTPRDSPRCCRLPLAPS